MARVSGPLADSGRKGTRLTTDFPVTLSMTQTSTESGDLFPITATTASAPRRAANNSSQLRDSPSEPSAIDPGATSTSKPADINSPWIRTKASDMPGAGLAELTRTTVAANTGVAQSNPANRTRV